MNFSEVVTQAPGSVENSGLVEVGLVRLVDLAFTLSTPHEVVKIVSTSW